MFHMLVVSGYPSQLANCPLVAVPGSFQSSEIFVRSLSFGVFFLMLKIPFIKKHGIIPIFIPDIIVFC